MDWGGPGGQCGPPGLKPEGGVYHWSGCSQTFSAHLSYLCCHNRVGAPKGLWIPTAVRMTGWGWGRFNDSWKALYAGGGQSHLNRLDFSKGCGGAFQALVNFGFTSYLVRRMRPRITMRLHCPMVQAGTPTCLPAIPSLPSPRWRTEGALDSHCGENDGSGGGEDSMTVGRVRTPVGGNHILIGLTLARVAAARFRRSSTSDLPVISFEECGQELPCDCTAQWSKQERLPAYLPYLRSHYRVGASKGLWIPTAVRMTG